MLVGNNEYFITNPNVLWFLSVESVMVLDETETDTKTVIIQCCDDEKFVVPLAVAKMSNLISTMINEDDLSDVIPVGVFAHLSFFFFYHVLIFILPLHFQLENVTAPTFAKIIDFCKHYNGKEVPVVQKPIKSTDLMEHGLSEWDIR